VQQNHLEVELVIKINQEVIKNLLVEKAVKVKKVREEKVRRVQLKLLKPRNL